MVIECLYNVKKKQTRIFAASNFTLNNFCVRKNLIGFGNTTV